MMRFMLPADSMAGRVSANVVETGLSAALSDAGPAGRVVARMAAQPARSLEDWQLVVDHPAVTGLREDPLFWTYVEHDNVEQALDRPVALRMLSDESLRARLAGLGLVSDSAAQDPSAFRSELAAVLNEVGPRVRHLREDPELQELMKDPEIVAAVQTGDTMMLLGHPRFRALVERAASRPVAETSQN